jgi:hypothetical protein
MVEGAETRRGRSTTTAGFSLFARIGDAILKKHEAAGGGESGNNEGQDRPLSAFYNTSGGTKQGRFFR